MNNYIPIHCDQYITILMSCRQRPRVRALGPKAKCHRHEVYYSLILRYSHDLKLTPTKFAIRGGHIYVCFATYYYVNLTTPLRFRFAQFSSVHEIRYPIFWLVSDMFSVEKHCNLTKAAYAFQTTLKTPLVAWI